MNPFHLLLFSGALFLFACSADVTVIDPDSSESNRSAEAEISSEATARSSEKGSDPQSSAEDSQTQSSVDSESSAPTQDESSTDVPAESSPTPADNSSTEPSTSSSSDAEVPSSDAPYIGEGVNAYDRIEAEGGTVAVGDVDLTGGGGTFIRLFMEGDVMKYADIDFGDAGPQGIIMHLAQGPGFDDATIDFVIDSPTGTPFATLTVATTTGWDDFQSQITAVPSSVTGIHDLYLVAHHVAAAGDIDWFQFSKSEIVAPQAPTELTLTADDSTITATWIDNANNETGYALYINNHNSLPTSPTVTLDANTTTYTFENMQSGTTFYVWVKALGAFIDADDVQESTMTKGDAPANSCLGVDHCADAQKGEWTLVVIPDTQHYSENRGNAPIQAMYTAFDWFVTMKDQLNIKFVQGLGDITESWNNGGQWDATVQAWEKLYGKIPFSVNQGNHDDPGTLNVRFPVSNFSGESWWGGFFEGTYNSYQKFTIGNEKYLFANIQSYDPWGIDMSTPGPINWINSVIQTHSDYKVILGTHDTWETTHVKENVLKKNANIVLSNAGHTCQREAHYTTTSPEGGESNNFITDYQCDANEVMLIRYYIFKPLEDKVDYFTYSPVSDAFEVDDSSQGSFSLVQADP